MGEVVLFSNGLGGFVCQWPIWLIFQHHLDMFMYILQDIHFLLTIARQSYT